MSTELDKVGVVAIGRNEGERLKRCLASAMREVDKVVYVDSGSVDGSVEYARSVGAEVVELDLSRPFTAARARNEGVRRLVGKWPEVEYLQVVDGDCEFAEGWLGAAVEALEQDTRCAVVCGRRRERHPAQSVYNRLIDLEWDTPIGVARSCGGDAMFLRSVYERVGGYRESLIAGEEPELCVRIRAEGWTVVRIDREMTLHDAAMTRFGQFWKRAKRAGHAYAEGAALHGSGPDRHGVRQTRSAIVWGLVLPVAAMVLGWWSMGVSLLALLVLYALQVWRIGRKELAKGRSGSDARLLAVATMLAKFAQVAGIGLYWRKRLAGQQSTLIEYKGAAPVAGQGGARG